MTDEHADGEHEEDPRKAYEDLRSKFGGTAADELKSGAWFAKIVQWVLETYAKKVDAEYIRKKYPGAGPANHAKKAVELASWYASLVGAASAGTVTALELSIPASAGWSTAVAVPAIASAVLGDVSLTTRVQLRAVYDLSVIHGAPLHVDDAEDCFLVFTTAMGIELAQGASEFARAVGPKIVAFNVRRMLQTGVRKALVDIIARVVGTQLAKKLTEKALMRILVPGISIPISAGMSYGFTRGILRTANKKMLRRGAVVRPLAELYQRVPALPRDAAVKSLIAVLEAPKRQDGWEEGQLDALRHTQSALELDDEAVGSLEGWFDRTPDDVVAELPQMTEKGGQALIEYLTTASALGAQAEHDAVYGAAIGKIAAGTGAAFTTASIATIRKRLA
jgi:hypothetical protein